MEVRNALSKALADGLYLLLDASNGPITGNLQMENIGVGGSAPSVAHMIIGSKVFTNEAVTVIGIGCFPEFSPTIDRNNTIVSVQGNTWFGTTNWSIVGGLVPTVRSLDFFPAPVGSGVGSADLQCFGVNTGGLLNIVGRTVTLDEATALYLAPIAHLDFGFPFTDNTTCNVARGGHIVSACDTNGTWGRLTALQIDKQSSGVINQGLWMHGDDVGADICFGAGSGNNPDAHIYYDGDDLIIDPQLLGTGGVKILNMKSGATQGAAGAAANELWFTVGHAINADRTVMIGV